MKNSTNKTFIKIAKSVSVLAFWVIVWQIIALIVDSETLVATPFCTLKNLVRLASEKQFYIIVGGSVFRILTGFFAAVILGSFLGICTAKTPFIDKLLSPLLYVIKATPVASFIILALFWLSKETIPSFISFLMVLPIVYGNIYEGIKNTPKELIEMTKIYNFSFKKKLTKLYIPTVTPYFIAGAKTSLGLAWKAGVAAEVISYTENSIGINLNSAKTYLETANIFSWTLTVILISIILEKALMFGINRITNRKRGA